MKIRLDKLLSIRLGVSRTEAKKLICRGHVSVDEETIRLPKAQVDDGAVLKFYDEELFDMASILVFHKPMGMVTTEDDPHERNTVGDVLPRRYHIVGRLDMDTHGLLLFSKDGQLTQQLLHPKREVEREYIAKVEGFPTPELIQQLADGIQTSVGLAKGKVLSIDGDTVRLVVQEGRNRIVRRMLHNAGHSVLDLQRVRFGAFSLQDLPVGEYREATKTELASIVQS